MNLEADLDETKVVDSLSAAESVVLARIREHSDAVAGLHEALESLASGGLPALRRLLGQAAELQARVGVPAKLLTKEVLLHAGLPVEGLEQ
ncbi:unnamed protein product, partial [Polarella glacialis]